MTTEAKTVEISGFTFEVRLLRTSEALTVFERVLAIVGPGLGKVFEGFKDGVPLIEQDIKLGPAVAEAFEKLGRPGALTELGELFKSSCAVRRPGQSNTPQLVDCYEEAFQGYPDVWARWVLACLEVNGFRRFFGTFDFSKSAAPAAPAKGK